MAQQVILFGYWPHKYKTPGHLFSEEVFRAAEKFTSIDLEFNWWDVNFQITQIFKKILTGQVSSSYGFVEDDTFKQELRVLLFTALDSSGLMSEYLYTTEAKKEGALKHDGVMELKDIDKVIELLTRFRVLVHMTATKGIPKELGKIGMRVEPPEVKLSFSQLFRPEFRDRVPEEVLILLGPGYAGAWTMGPEHDRQWTHDGPENSVITPFYILVDSGFIDIPPRGKRSFIQTWLREFGVEYKPKTFDNGSRGITYEYFNDYLSRIKK